MRFIFIFMMIAAVAISCDRNDVYRPKTADFENIAPFASYEVPTKEGEVTIVTYGDDTLAITGIPMVIEVPKYALRNTTKSGDGIKVQYSTDAKFEGYKDTGTSQARFTLFFEDTRNGDDDYNDMILAINRTEVINKDIVTCRFEIYPIALGATKDFKLGFVEERNGKEIIVAENCRRDLFGGRTGFINTVPEIAMVTDFDKFETPEYIWNRSDVWGRTFINWFIETDTERMYIALSEKVVNQENIQIFGNDKGRPFGIAMPWNNAKPYDIILGKSGPYYPVENSPIQKLYGNFEDWINGVWTEPLTNGGGKGVNNTDPTVCYNISNRP